MWVNALRCLAAGGLPLPQALAAAGHPHTWMLDSGYTSVDGAVLAKPGTALVEGQLLFCRCVVVGFGSVWLGWVCVGWWLRRSVGSITC